MYLHYCGGELEEVSYITKTNNCCNDDSNDGCCKNEGKVIKCDHTLTLKKNEVLVCQTSIQQLFTVVHFSFRLPFKAVVSEPSCVNHPPPKISDHIIDSTVLRI